MEGAHWELLNLARPEDFRAQERDAIAAGLAGGGAEGGGEGSGVGVTT